MKLIHPSCLSIRVVAKCIKMAPFEALYGRKCRTPLNWVELGERRYYGIDFVKEAKEQVRIIQQHIETAQAQQKSYADKRRLPLKWKIMCIKKFHP